MPCAVFSLGQFLSLIILRLNEESVPDSNCQTSMRVIPQSGSPKAA